MSGSHASNNIFALGNIGRRAAPRLRLSIPARLVTLYETRRCILLNLSRTGAQIGIENPLELEEAALLQVAHLEQFGLVVRRGKGMLALAFDEPLDDQQVPEIRHYSGCIEEHERERLRNEARAWVHGAK